jgi:hypothetical protein
MNRWQFASILFTLLLMFSSCAPLSKSQVKLSHNYFETIANYPLYHRQLNTQVAQVCLESMNLESSLQKSDSQRVAMIIISIKEYEKALEIPDSIASHLRYIENYVQNYYVLLPNGFNVYQALKGTTETISNMFGLGAIAKSILPKNISGLNTVKKKRIKNHLVNSEKDLLKSLDAIKYFIDKTYLPTLENINTSSIDRFEELLIGIKNKPDALEYYTLHNRMLTKFYQNLFLTKSLAASLSRSIDPFVRTEKHIINKLSERQKIDSETVHLNELVREIQRIKKNMIDLGIK